jgi:hypothetical protein
MQLRSQRHTITTTTTTTSLSTTTTNTETKQRKTIRLEEVLVHEEDHVVVETILSTTGPLSRNRFRSNLVGLSCLMIGLPGLLYIQKGQPFMGFVGAFMGLLSFYSDYVFACPFTFDMKFRRRAFAIDLVWITLYLGGIFVNLLRDSSYKSVVMLFFGILSGKILFLDWSARAETPAEWEWRHSWWHVIITGLAFASHGEIMPRKDSTLELDVFHTCITFMGYAFIAWLLTTLTDFVLAKSHDKKSFANDWYVKWSKGRYPSRLDIIRSVTWNGN